MVLAKKNGIFKNLGTNKGKKVNVNQAALNTFDVLKASNGN